MVRCAEMLYPPLLSSRIRAVYSRIYTVDSRIFAVALRIFAFSTRVSRKHYSYYVIDGSHTVCRRFWYCGTPRKSAVWATVQNRGGCSTLQCCFFAVICRQLLKLDNTQWLQSEDVDTQFPQSNRAQLLWRCVMELLALTAVAAMVIVRTKRQKEAELAARERRNMKRQRRLWVKKWLLRRAQFGQYDKRKYFGRRKAAVVLRKVAEGLRFTCGQYASFTVFAVSLRFTAFRRFRKILAEKLNTFNFSASTRGTCGRSRKRAVHLAVYLRWGIAFRSGPPHSVKF